MNKFPKLIFDGIISGEISRDVGIELLKRIKQANNEEYKDKDIAIIGMSLRLPHINNIDEFWECILGCKDCINEFPDSRAKDVEEFKQYIMSDYKNLTYRKGAYIKEIDKFDYDYFRIPPREADIMSPEQKIFMEVAMEAIDDAGYGGKRIVGSRTGVYVGVNSNSYFDYKRLIYEMNPSTALKASLGNLTSMIPSRLSYFLDLKGPSMTIDTACSSSLVAVHTACQAIRNGDCDQAIVSGINLHLVPLNVEKTAGIASSDGKAKTFNDSADGTAIGEGVVAVILKSYKKACKDGDNIYTVIKGTAINQDGKSVGITAPNVLAQEDVILRAWEDARIDPETLTYIEAHGTGTKLGDPIEIEGITRAFRKYTNKKQFCGIGSVKTNIGHLDHASGIIGLIKATLCINKKKVPASIHFDRPNRMINFIETPVYVCDKTIELKKDGVPSRCGVSSFGISGTNCHVVIEEVLPNIVTSSMRDGGLKLLTLSAKNEKSLKELLNTYLKRYHQYIGLSLEDICYTLNTGREHYTCRLGIIVNSYDDFFNKIKMIYHGDLSEIDIDGVFYGNHKIVPEVKEEKEKDDYTEVEIRAFSRETKVILEQFISNAKQDVELVAKILKLYSKGADIEWDILYQSEERRYISLPTYQFNKERCWMNEHYVIPRIKNNVMNVKSTEDMSNEILLDSPKLFDEKEKESFMSEVKENNIFGRKDGKYTNTEKMISKFWNYVMGFEVTDLFGDFFQMGGDSLLAMKIVNQINEMITIPISIAHIFQYPTIYDISKYIDENCISRYSSKDIDSLTKSELENKYYPVLLAQKRLFALEGMEDVGTTYNLVKVLRIKANIDKVRMQKALEDLVYRHEALRCSFEVNNEEVIQKIHNEVDIILDYIESDKESSDYIINNFSKPFSLTCSPLFRTVLIKISEQEYIMVFDIHHIISDAYSMQILLRDFFRLYNGVKLNKSKLSYIDYIESLSKGNIEERTSNQERFWINVLGGDIPVLNLPTDYPRPSVKQFEGNKIHFNINSRNFDGLNNIVKDIGTTMYVVLMAAFNILLYKYTGQEDIIVGTVTSGREDIRLDEVVGMFIKTLPIRSYPEGHKTWKQFLIEVKDSIYIALENQECDLSEIVSKISLIRDNSRNILFDAMFIMQSDVQNSMKFGDIEVEIENENIKTTKYDITMNAIKKKDEILFNIEFSTKLFSKKTMKKLAQHFCQIIDEIVSNQDVRLADIKMISEEEKEILFKFNNTETAYDDKQTINKLIEKQTKQTPDNIAVVCGNSKLTYKELNQKSNQLARFLHYKGITKDSIVAIMLNRSTEMLESILAILKSGGAYMPLDPEYPSDRISYMLEDSRSNVLITQKHVLDKTKINFDGEIIFINDIDLRGFEKTNYSETIESNNLAYVIYTSGSTGKPKGVMIEHKSVVNFINGITHNVDFSEPKTVLSLTSISFDIHVLELILPLTNGSMIVIANENEQTDMNLLSQSILHHKVDVIQMTPSRMQMLLNEEDIGVTFKNIDTLFLGGEKLLEGLYERIKDIYNGKLFNMYGPTETTIWSTMKQITNSDINIGKPLANTRVYIVDSYGNLLPVGIVGELCIAGDGLAGGYLNKGEITQEKFVNAKFDENIKLYKTGDLAKWRENGEIDILDRLDNQIKIHGYRIEPEEIERHILKYKGISEVAIIAREDEGSKNKYLYCYVVADEKLEIAELKAYLADKVPGFMIPNFFILLSNMPLTPNGKVNKNALPVLARDLIEDKTYEMPRNDREKTLVTLWREVIGIDKISIIDNFFEIGGHSLNATALISTINKKFNIKLEIRDLFKYNTIKKLGNYIETLSASIYNSIKPTKLKGYYPLSSAQKRIYIVSNVENNTSYNISGALKIDGSMDILQLEKTFAILVKRHEAFRTSFEIHDGQPVQIIHENVDFNIRYAESNTDDFDGLVKEFIKPFCCEKAPLIRVTLVKLEENSHILIYDMHHIIADGTSLGILEKEFMSLYNGNQLTQMNLQYKDFSEWQNEMISCNQMKKYEQYWMNIFDNDIPRLNLPTDYKRPDTQDFSGACVDMIIDKELSDMLKKIAVKSEASLFMVLLSIFNVLLSKYTGQEDIIVGTPIAGRNHADLDNIIGMFVNRLALRNYPQGNKEFIVFLMEVKENVLNAFENQEYPFELLVDKLNIPRMANRNPLTDIIFAFQNYDTTEIKLKNIDQVTNLYKNSTSNYDITMFVRETKEGISINVEYATSLFRKSSIEKLLYYYVKIATIIVNDINVKIRDIEIASDIEKIEILSDLKKNQQELEVTFDF